VSLNLKKHLKNDWLKGSDLEEGERLTVTIEKVYEHTFPSGDESIVVEFLELDQKLSLNKTRLTKLVELLGDDAAEWKGRQVALYPVDVSFGGKNTLGVAIGAVARKKAARPADDDLDGDVVFRSGRN
jgi:hypothetical protein